MKIQLTRGWTNLQFDDSFAEWKVIYLSCRSVNYTTPAKRLDAQTTIKFNEIRWIGQVSIGCSGGKRSNNNSLTTNIKAGVYLKIGPQRRCKRAAQQDAERLAVELLQDIRDGTKELMDLYGMEED